MAGTPEEESGKLIWSQLLAQLTMQMITPADALAVGHASLWAWSLKGLYQIQNT